MRTRSLHVSTLLVAALAALSACGDDRGSLLAPPSAPTAVISDGSRDGGNPNFFFLAPLVANPSSDPDFTAGAFVGTWKPIVRVCRLTDALACETNSLGEPAYLRTFQGSEVAASAAEELYKVEWSTAESWATSGTYRASVFIAGTRMVELGFIDVALLPDQQSVKNMRSGEIVPLQDGRTVPLKFRIESGASVSPTTVDYVEAVVTDAGGTVATGQGGAGIHFDAGFLPDGVESVVVSVQRVAPASTSNDCHGLDVNLSWLRQYEGCYRVETFPAIGILQADAVFGVCTESPLLESQVMYKSDPLPEGGRRVKALENVPLPTELAEALNCEGFTGLAAAPHSESLRDRMTFGALRVMASIGRAISPRSAYALDFGEGGQLRALEDDLSDFSWAVPVAIGEGSGDGQSAVAGATLAQPISVLVVAAHSHDDEAVYIDGVPVTFTVSAGNLGGLTAVIQSVTVPSDANGLATAPAWTLPGNPGTYTLTATIPDDSSNNPVAVPQHRSITFTATAVAPIGITTLQTGADIGSAVQLVANSRTSFRATLPGATTSCGITPATGDADMYVYWAQDDIGTLLAIEARTETAQPRTVTVTCGSISRSFTVTITEPPTMVAASCGPANYATGDQIFRGFYMANYPHVQLAGVDLQFAADVAGTYTVNLTAQWGAFGGGTIASGTATMNVGLDGTRTLGAFRWPSATVPQNSTVAFSMTQVSGPGTLYYSVYQSFDGDASCPLMETNGTTPPLDTDRRRGVEAILYSSFAPIG